MEKASTARTDGRPVPSYGLYGEQAGQAPDFWIHAESIASRSRLYNWEIRQHRHENFFQILHIRGGTGDAVLATGTARLEPGTIVLVPERITHGYRFSHDIDGQVITLLTSRLPGAGGYRQAFLRTPHVIAIPPGHGDGAYLVATLDRIGAELAAGFGARHALIEAYLQAALSLAQSLVAPVSGSQADGRDTARIARLNALIGRHFREHRPAAFYATELGVSATHLNRICRTGTGRTLNELLTDKIMSEARRDLVFTVFAAQEIAYGLGFADPAYFTRFFTRHAGETPRAFRERERRAQMPEIG